MRLTIILSSKLTLSSACQFAVKIEREPGIRTLKAELKVLNGGPMQFCSFGNC